MQGQSSDYQMINNQMPSRQFKHTFDVEEPARRNGPQEWKNPLCGCFDDMGSCCMTLWCPCVQYGKNYENVHHDGCGSQGAFFCLLGIFGLSCCLHSELRSEIRERYNIQEDCSDCCVTCFCPGFAIAQEARELKDRG